MPWAIQYQTLPFKGSWSYNFEFPGGVSSYIVGIPYFYFTFVGTSFHAVQQLGLSLGSPSQLASGQDQITVNVNPTLSDASGTTIDLGQSSVMVAVIAWTGDDPSQVMLPSAPVTNNQTTPVTVPTGTPALQAVLSGFELEYASAAHPVEKIDVSISASLQSPGSASLSATVSMNDASGNSANGSGNSTATITGSLLATSLSSPGFVKKQLSQQQSSHPVCVNFSSQLGSAVPLITAFQVQYANDAEHYVKLISAGTESWSVNGSTVVLNSPQALMYDTVNNQDNTASNVSFVVIGIPTS
jgi:hypothetical protein